jgi:predicted dehydrogenase
MKKPWRTAIVGNLQALNVLLPAFQAVPGFEVTALCGRNEEAVRGAAANAGVRKVHQAWEPLAEDPDIEVVALALPPLLQSQAAVKLAAAGKHLFCEKPLAADLTGAQAIAEAVTGHQRVAAVNFGFRMIEAFRDFQAIGQSGILGAPQFGVVEWLLATRRNPALTWNWKSDARLGGGALNMMTSHVLDYLGWIFGEMLAVRLQTAALVPARPETGSGRLKPVQADDSNSLLLTLSPHLPVNVIVSTALSVARGHRLRVWFENGLLELANSPDDDFHDGFKLTFYPAKNTGASLDQEVRRRAAFSHMEACFPGRIAASRRVVEEFALALAGAASRMPTLAEALRVQKWMERARLSQA